ncbi:MAG: hypothetical protein IJ513_04590, partial [Bacteroidaceae bacterium]|nr:hypothetical protein [Bacteroidaceae bacterium]
DDEILNGDIDRVSFLYRIATFPLYFLVAYKEEVLDVDRCCRIIIPFALICLWSVRNAYRLPGERGRFEVQ